MTANAKRADKDIHHRIGASTDPLIKIVVATHLRQKDLNSSPVRTVQIRPPSTLHVRPSTTATCYSRQSSPTRRMRLPLLQGLLTDTSQQQQEQQVQNWRNIQSGIIRQRNSSDHKYYDCKDQEIFGLSRTVPIKVIDTSNVPQITLKTLADAKKIKGNSPRSTLLHQESLMNAKHIDFFLQTEQLIYDALKYCSRNSMIRLRKVCRLYTQLEEQLIIQCASLIEDIFLGEQTIQKEIRQLLLHEIAAMHSVFVFAASTGKIKKKIEKVHLLLKYICLYLNNNAVLLIELLIQVVPKRFNKDVLQSLKEKWMIQCFKEQRQITTVIESIKSSQQMVQLIAQNNRLLEDLLQQLFSQAVEDASFFKDFNAFRIENQQEIDKQEDYIRGVTELVYRRNQQIAEVDVKWPSTNGEGRDDIENPDEEWNQSDSLSIEDIKGGLKKRVHKFLGDFDVDRYRYTLILDLDETLIHYCERQGTSGNDGYFLVRPYVTEFLKELSKHYEIVVFSIAVKEYVQWILEFVDPEKCIQNTLFKEHTVFDGENYLKDLSRLGRSLTRTIIIENRAENIARQPENAILVPSWYGDPNDQTLFDLLPILKCKINLSDKDSEGGFNQGY